MVERGVAETKRSDKRALVAVRMGAGEGVTVVVVVLLRACFGSGSEGMRARRGGAAVEGASRWRRRAVRCSEVAAGRVGASRGRALSLRPLVSLFSTNTTRSNLLTTAHDQASFQRAPQSENKTTHSRSRNDRSRAPPSFPARALASVTVS